MKIMCQILSEEEKTEIAHLLKKVNVSRVCRELGINRVLVWRTLRRDGKGYEAVRRVAAEVRGNRL